MGINRTWFSVASDIEELKQLAQKLVEKDGGQKAKTLSAKMLAAVPRFEATEEVNNPVAPTHSLVSLTILYRSGSAENIVKPESSSLRGQSMDSRYMRVVLVESA